ncbi:MAG: hypothetical protein WBX38_20090 [Candidatus Sulfotelmatobacter sp.]
MTMAAGFVCRDGLVIAADRQFTSDLYTYQECKLSEVRWQNGVAIWGYSGSPETARRVNEELQRRFNQNSMVLRADIEGTLASALKDASFGKKEVWGILFGAWTEGEERILFSSSGTRVSVVPRCEVIGWGDSPLARYLRGLYLRMGQLTVWQASVLGMYFILQGKTYDGKYIGGPTDVFIIDKNRKRQEIPIASSRIWETLLEDMDQQIASLFLVMTDSNQFHGQRNEALGKFISKADLFGNQVRALKAKEDTP